MPAESKNGPGERVRHADTHCENDQSVLGVISCLNRMIAGERDDAFGGFGVDPIHWRDTRRVTGSRCGDEG